jgi:hypothetical protein
MRETYTRVDEETLEATDAGLNERQQLVRVPGDDTAIKADINPALALAGSKLHLEPLEGGGGRDGIQGHVDDGGDTARGGGLGTRLEALPLGAARLVEVDMCIDQARDKDPRAVVCVHYRRRKGRPR